MRLNLKIDEPEFLPVETQILANLLDKHEQYIAQGRDLEAKGVERSAYIVWAGLEGAFGDTQPSEWSGL